MALSAAAPTSRTPGGEPMNHIGQSAQGSISAPGQVQSATISVPGKADPNSTFTATANVVGDGPQFRFEWTDGACNGQCRWQNGHCTGPCPLVAGFLVWFAYLVG